VAFQVMEPIKSKNINGRARTYLIYVGVPHFGEELHGRGRVRVVVGELHHGLFKDKNNQP